MENNFSDWLQIEMELRKISQSELARRAGVSRGTISNIINGLRGIGPDVAEGIAKALNISSSFVMKKAGLLSESINENENYEELNNLFSQLSPQEREEFLMLLRFKADRANEKANEIIKKSTSRGKNPARSTIEQ